MEPKITVIVPIYNVEKYLSQCINSIVNQTYNNLEIILVDDGSPDNCPQLCDAFEKEDARIKVIHKGNGGLSSARNAGLEIATGDYITFVDSDDWLELNMYEVLYTNLIKEDADVSACANIGEFGKEGTMFKQERLQNITVYTELREMYKHLLPTSQPTLLFMVWNKLFKRDIVGDIRFQIGQIYEDMYFEREVLKRCKKIVYSDYVGYHYRIGRGGSTATFFKEIKLNKFKEINSYIEMLKGYDDIESVREYNRYGCDTAMELYYSGWSNNVKSNILRRIYDWYNVYEKDKFAPPIKSKTMKIFELFPRVYCIIYLIYFKLRDYGYARHHRNCII